MRLTPGVDLIELFGVNLLTLFSKIDCFITRRFFLSVFQKDLAYKKSKYIYSKKNL